MNNMPGRVFLKKVNGGQGRETLVVSWLPQDGHTCYVPESALAALEARIADLTAGPNVPRKCRNHWHVGHDGATYDEAGAKAECDRLNAEPLRRLAALEARVKELEAENATIHERYAALFNQTGATDA